MSSHLLRSVVLALLSILACSFRMQGRQQVTRLAAAAAEPEKLSPSWEKYFKRSHDTKYQLICAPGMETIAKQICASDPDRFLMHKISWNKFPGNENTHTTNTSSLFARSFFVGYRYANTHTHTHTHTHGHVYTKH